MLGAAETPPGRRKLMRRAAETAPGGRALGIASHGVVILWLGLYLAWPAVETSDALLESPLARIQPRAEEPPRPETSASDPAADRAPQPVPVTAAEISAGARLLDAAGSFPALSSSYDDFASFADYARAMVSLGARFAIVRDREIVGSIDPATGAIGGTALDRAFSPRARDYTGEPGLAGLTRTARERFGSGAVVMMLVPHEIDAGLFGGIARALERSGESHLAVREIQARYQRAPGGRVHLRVDTAVRLDGTRLAMDLVFDLSGIAGAAEPPA